MNDALSRALDDVTVVALATNIPGPLAASRLRAMGARVVKIEPARGDGLASASPKWYEEIHRGIEIVKLDLRSPGDRARLEALLGEADVLITAMRGGALARLDLGWDDLHARHPRLSHVAVVGEAAPNDDRAGHDLTYQAQSGLIAPPAMPRTVLADLAAAERAVCAALAALHSSRRSGEGVRCEVAIVEAAREFAVPFRYGLTSPDGVLGGALPAYRLYRTRDGWVAVAALEAHFAEATQRALNVERLDETSLRVALESRTTSECERLAAEHDLPLAAVV